VFGIKIFGSVHTRVSVSFSVECEDGRPGLVSSATAIKCGYSLCSGSNCVSRTACSIDIRLEIR
jgi:hypothetical protein